MDFIPLLIDIEPTTEGVMMSPLIVAAIVFAGGGIGYAIGLRKRMENNPDLQGKGLKVLFKNNKDQKK